MAALKSNVAAHILRQRADIVDRLGTSTSTCLIKWFRLLLSLSESGSEDYLYGYTPTPYICYIFLGIFGVSTGLRSDLIYSYLVLTSTTVLHLGWAIWYRRWFMLLTATSCGVGELLGWAG
jgi:hypothetical protein